MRNLSPSSISWYRASLSVLDEVRDARLEDLTLKPLKHLIAQLLDDKAPGTVNGYIGGIKAMLNYAVDCGYPVRFNTRRLRKVKEPKKVPPCFTPEQVQALLKQPDRSSFYGLRNYTMMCLLLDVGIRLGELLGLRVHHVVSPHLKVFGKGSKERIVAMSDVMVKRLNKYLRARKRLLKRAEMESDVLFVSRYGRELCGRAFHDILKHYGEQAGIEGVRVSAHTFRYTYTSMALRSGMSLTSLQTCLGHTTLTMTRHYAVLNDADAFDEAIVHSPLAAIEG